MEDEETGEFFKFPRWLLEVEITNNSRVFYLILKDFGGKAGIAFPKRETLARLMRTNIRTVDRYSKELIDNNLIVVRRRGLNQSNEYTFPHHPWMDG